MRLEILPLALDLNHRRSKRLVCDFDRIPGRTISPSEHPPRRIHCLRLDNRAPPRADGSGHDRLRIHGAPSPDGPQSSVLYSIE